MSTPWAKFSAALAEEQAREELGGEAIVEAAGTAAARRVGRKNLRKAVVVGAGVLAVVGAAVVFTNSGALHPQPQGRVGDSVELMGIAALAAAAAEAAGTAAKLSEDFQGSKKDMGSAWSAFTEPMVKLKEELKQQPPPENLTAMYAALRGAQLFPQNHLDDGNPCPDEEEEHLGLCYKKCSNLTEGGFPIRTTAFSCCKEEPCSFFNSKFSNPLLFCQGYDVGTSHQVSVCPHKPGDCLINEEFKFGICYKRCGLLTNWQYPFRASAISCCRYDSKLACADATNLITNASFAIGGGVGHPLLLNYTKFHDPIPALAELHGTVQVGSVTMDSSVLEMKK